MNKYFANKVRKVGAENVVADLLEITSPETRFEREYFWINEFRERGHRLTNLQFSQQPQWLAKRDKYEDPVYLRKALCYLLSPRKTPHQETQYTALADRFEMLAYRTWRHAMNKWPVETVALLCPENGIPNRPQS